MTEYVYKQPGRKRSIHLENLSMYLWGTVANILQFYVANFTSDTPKSMTLQGLFCLSVFFLFFLLFVFFFFSFCEIAQQKYWVYLLNDSF